MMMRYDLAQAQVLHSLHLQAHIIMSVYTWRVKLRRYSTDTCNVVPAILILHVDRIILHVCVRVCDSE